MGFGSAYPGPSTEIVEEQHLGRVLREGELTQQPQTLQYTASDEVEEQWQQQQMSGAPSPPPNRVVKH